MTLIDQTIKKEVLPDTWAAGLEVVFCGTAPSKRSANASAYYANSRNRFWEILAECKLTSRQLRPEEFGCLSENKIGLTDLCKFTFGNDDQLAETDFSPNRLRSALQKYSPLFLAFTSANAGSKFFGRKVCYGPEATLGTTRTYILPTTSPRRGHIWWGEKKIHWIEFANLVHRERQQ